eukprot:c46667_g1_i1.p1 GENE.c46667_g1_i1~~c46667_g1_i1.p1  ORF type:complete len:303 (+),score=68.30 c46667_g1_i1:23-931(+)
MCIVFLALGVSDEFPVIFAANRDEHFCRQTQNLHKWVIEQGLSVFGGRDFEKQGTWFAVSELGGFGTLTNFRKADEDKVVPERSRGGIVTDFLSMHAKSHDTDSAANALANQQFLYSGFNTIVGDLKDLTSFRFYCNHTDTREVIKLPAGIHVLTNAHLNTPWPKAEHGRALFAQIIAQSSQISSATTDAKKQLAKALFETLLTDATYFDEIPNTGDAPEVDDLCSTLFVPGKYYGTRSMAVCVVDSKGAVLVSERARPTIESPDIPPTDPTYWQRESQTPQDRFEGWAEEEIEFALPVYGE